MIIVGSLGGMCVFRFGDLKILRSMQIGAKVGGTGRGLGIGPRNILQ
jgi:hypothetical protein